MKIIVEIKKIKNPEKVFFELLRKARKYHIEESTPLDDNDICGFSSFSVFKEKEKIGFSLSSCCCNTHIFYLTNDNVLLYEYNGSRYGLSGAYPTILSVYFDTRKIYIENFAYEVKKEYTYKEWKEKAKEIWEWMYEKPYTQSYVYIRIANKKYIAKIIEYETSAEQWKLLPFELVVYKNRWNIEQETKPVGAIPLYVWKEPCPVDITQLTEEQKKYIRFFE